MSISQIIRSSLFLLFPLYYLQGIIYPRGSLVSQSCLLFILLISAGYFIKTLFDESKKDSFFTWWTLLLFLNIIGFIITANYYDINDKTMLKFTLGSMLPFYPFYILARNNELKANHLVVFLILMIPVSIAQFFLERSEEIIESLSGNTEIVNNAAYMFVTLIPFVFLIRGKRLVKVGLMLLIMFFIIQGAKRGAILAGIIGLVLYFYFELKATSNSNKLLNLIIVLAIILAISDFIIRSFTNNSFLISRITAMSEGNVSGRDVIYSTIFNHWYYSDNFWNLLLGFGYASSIDIAGNQAHSDWLELLSNFGLIGFCFYLALFYAAIKHCFNKGWMNDKRILMLTVILIWLPVSIYSMCYNALGWFPISILLAYLTGSKSVSLE